jgi:hypothetical protein
MRNLLRKFPFHTFLFLPFLVLFMLCHNYAQVKLSMVFRALGIGLACSVLLFFLFRLFFKESKKSGIFTSVILISFFNYGIVYEWLEGMYYSGSWPFHNIHRYLLGLFICIFISSFVLVKRTKRDLSTFNFFLNTIVGLLLLYNLATFFYLSANQKTPPAKANTNEAPLSNADHPDIYYIVLDGYANEHILQKYYSYDNSPFIKHLQARGFYIADSSFSNYYYTRASLASTFNMDYLGTGQDLSEKLRSNKVFHVLKENGYELINLKSGYSVTYDFTEIDHTIEISGPNEFERAVMRYTILRLDDITGLFSYIRLKSQFRNLDAFFSFTSKPKLCFIHIVSPHPPFVLNKEGQFRMQKKFGNNFWEPKEYYTDQMEYTSRQVQLFVDKILSQKSRTPPIIIIQSDHGPWLNAKNPDEVFDVRSHILNAMLLPDETRKKLYPAISSVNTFRLVLSAALNIPAELLPDRKEGKQLLETDPVFEKKFTR